MDKNKQYVVLEHLMLPDRGFRFFSTNCRYRGADPDNIKENNTHGYTGEQWYEEVGFADTVEEAQALCNKVDQRKIPTWNELYEYHRKEAERRDKILAERLKEDQDK